MELLVGHGYQWAVKSRVTLSGSRIQEPGPEQLTDSCWVPALWVLDPFASLTMVSN